MDRLETMTSHSEQLATDAALREKILDIVKAQTEAMVQPNAMADHLG